MKSYPFITQKYTNSVVSIDLVKQWLEMDIAGYDGKDDLIKACIASAVSSVETECNFELGISSYEWNTFGLPCEIRDTYHIQTIDSIAYKGGDSPESDGYTIIHSNMYELMRVSKRRSSIFWHPSLPDLKADLVKVKFKAGLETVPDDLLQAIRARIGEHFVNRGDGVSEKRTLSDKLLSPYVIPYVG